ncbi:hypothetical protein SAMN05421839_13110 [Halolactibacillus halophilus]|uniref:Uncharacterized protein n=1 Tax=Halolactibacillus halophilus TaxID=306540 RepID=A0A1I5RLY5_9BACI|nr:hypothetical protein [Halolactibacillus halophilus]GEM02472.1 hypothetical protein HHA03_20040 [Halolactibacillus halophilus]SFP58926.1 hypothetical protein SAMN05421839_13110 [Halolactibacillus halophilus]
MKPRSLLLIISSIWAFIYANMLYPSPEDLEGLKAFLIVFLVWPGFLFFQLICYALFKKYQNQKIYVGLILIKTTFFLIQPIIIENQLNPLFFYLTILGIFLIDFHIMTLENMINFKELTMSEQEKKDSSEYFKVSWFLMGSVTLLFALYFQLSEGNEGNYMMIISFSFMYIFLFLRKQEPKGKFIFVQLFGLLAVYLLAILDAPEFLKGILLIGVLFLIYQIKKHILNKNNSSNIVD